MQQALTVGPVFKSAASQGNHHVTPLIASYGRDHPLFKATKISLAAVGENATDFFPRGLYNQAVGINKSLFQAAGKLVTHARLAGTGKADKVYVLLRVHSTDLPFPEHSPIDRGKIDGFAGPQIERPDSLPDKHC